MGECVCVCLCVNVPSMWVCVSVHACLCVSVCVSRVGSDNGEDSVNDGVI